MNTKDVSTLQIHKLSQEQYDSLAAADKVDDYAIYLTPNSFTGVGGAAGTIEGLEAALATKADQNHIHTIDKITDLQTTLDAKAEAENVAYIYAEDDEDVSDNLELNANVQAAVNSALAQAQSSGMFNGEDGEDGNDGEDGVSVTHSWNGTVLTITSASGTSTIDLKGEDGEDGSNGTSATHSWDGTVLTVTSASGSSSADLKGEKGEKGDDGDDYVLTDADKSEIAQETKGLFDETIADITAIANGQCKAYVFDNENDLDAALAEYNSGSMSETNILNGQTLKTGDVFYLRATGVSDYWWDDSTKTKQILETAEVPLTDYALKSDIPESLSELSADDSHLLVTKAEKEAWSAKSNFSGNYRDLNEKPTSLPANGGNADTVGGYQIVVSNTIPTSGTNDSIITIVI